MAPPEDWFSSGGAHLYLLVVAVTFDDAATGRTDVNPAKDAGISGDRVGSSVLVLEVIDADKRRACVD